MIGSPIVPYCVLTFRRPDSSERPLLEKTVLKVAQAVNAGFVFAKDQLVESLMCISGDGRENASAYADMALKTHAPGLVGTSKIIGKVAQNGDGVSVAKQKGGDSSSQPNAHATGKPRRPLEQNSYRRNRGDLV